MTRFCMNLFHGSRRNVLQHGLENVLGALTIGACLAVPFAAAQAADGLLTGVVQDDGAKAMGGVTISAKADGSSITTSVFTDETGHYYFPPLADGHYKVWAQALKYQTAKSDVTLSATSHQDFAMKPLADFVTQLPGDVMLTALPDSTPHDAQMKTLVQKNCTGCHTPSFTLQHKFDAAGWTAIITLMERVNATGTYGGPKKKPNGLLERNKKDLAEYLARARGPGESSMKFDNIPPRPSGEAARVVIKEYAIPVPAEQGMDKLQTNDGSDWSLGTQSRIGSLPHDAWPDLDGNIWFNSNAPNHQLTIARIDGKTGAIKYFRVNGAKGFAAVSHGITRDANGILWFNVNPGRGSLGRLDPKDPKIEVFVPPPGMKPTGGAPTVDVDGKGKIWATTDDGALRFDPDTATFTEYKSKTQEDASTTHGRTYGIAADRDGNGWWAQMQIDTIGHGIGASGAVSEVKLPPIKAQMDLLDPEQKQFYEHFKQPDFNTPVPWSQGPRRMGTDKNGDVLWVGDSWGSNLARIDTKTGALSFVPMPWPSLQPYQITVDKDHNAWTNLWTTDRVARYSPSTKQWTVFDLPTRGTEARYISLLEKDGQTHVVVPYSRASKVGVLTLRSEKDIDDLKKRLQ